MGLSSESKNSSVVSSACVFQRVLVSIIVSVESSESVCCELDDKLGLKTS